MVCPKCGSENVTVQLVSETGKAKHGIIWWLCVGWWWVMIKAIGWFCFGLLMLIPKLFGAGKNKTTTRKWAVCQQCAHKWQV